MLSSSVAFVGKGALAAVGGSSAVLSNLIIGCFTGLASGASVIVSQFYGAKDERNLQKSLHTAYAFSVILSIVFTILGWALTPFLLKLIDTPADTLADSILYLRIYFLGIFGTLIFNIGSAIMRSIGDSRRPLYYLIICCFLNIILDLVLVIVFDMGNCRSRYRDHYFTGSKCNPCHQCTDEKNMMTASFI